MNTLGSRIWVALITRRKFAVPKILDVGLSLNFISFKIRFFKTRRAVKTIKQHDDKHHSSVKPAEKQLDMTFPQCRLTNVSSEIPPELEENFLPDGKYNNKYKSGSRQNIKVESVRNKNKYDIKRPLPLKRNETLFETPTFKYANCKTLPTNIEAVTYNSAQQTELLKNEKICDVPCQVSHKDDATFESEIASSRTDNDKVYKHPSPKLSIIEMQKFNRASYETLVPSNGVTHPIDKPQEKLPRIKSSIVTGCNEKANLLEMEETFYRTYKIFEGDDDKNVDSQCNDGSVEPKVGYILNKALLEMDLLNTSETCIPNTNILEPQIAVSNSSTENKLVLPDEEIIEFQSYKDIIVSSVEDLLEPDCEQNVFQVKQIKEFTEIERTDIQNKKVNKVLSSTSLDLLEMEEYVHDSSLRRSKRRGNRSFKIEIQGEILFGYYPVLISLQNSRRKFHKIYLKQVVTNVSRQNEIEKLATERGIDVLFVDVPTLDRICERPVHQGICADVSLMEKLYHSDKFVSGEVVSGTETGNFPLWLVLDCVHDPMNFGAILRSAYFFGVDRIFQCERNSCKLSPVVSKASAGIMELIDIHTLKDIHNFLEICKAKGWQVVGTCSSDFPGHIVDLRDFQLEKPTILIVGNEGRGMKQSTYELCDHLVTIRPANALHPSVDSLNVGVATGVILSRLLSKGPLLE